jgi:uncharacterized protein YgiM (DUF1202 family)
MYFICVHVNTEKKKAKYNDKLWYVIDDKDGYVNIRSGSNIRSRVLFRIKNGQKFKILESSGKKWFKIIYMNTEGFIHKSRVKKLESNDE